MSKALGKHFVVSMRFFTIKMQEGEDLLVHMNMVKALVD